MVDWLQSVLDWYMYNVNYWSVLVCMTIESSIIPFPAELIVPRSLESCQRGPQFHAGRLVQHNRISIRCPFQLRAGLHAGAQIYLHVRGITLGKDSADVKRKNRKIRTIFFEIRQKFHSDWKTYPRGKKFYFTSGRTGQNAIKQLYILYGSRKRYMEPDPGDCRLLFIFPKRTTGKVFHRNLHCYVDGRNLLFRVSYFSVNT